MRSPTERPSADAPTGAALALNCGSSSLKFALFGADDERLASGAVEGIGGAGRVWIRRADASLERMCDCPDHLAALDVASTLLAEHCETEVTAIGHRVVHGGVEHLRPTLVDDALVSSLRRLVPLAPLHLPPTLAVLDAARASAPTLPQVACFDTAFHATMPAVASRLPLPERYAEARRYGFHGLSYESVLATLGAEIPPRTIIAHLGNGASLVAVRDGRSIDTTMGMTPSGGILMGTRTGDLDPGVLLWLAREKGLSLEALQHMVDHESGLLALGGSSDMRELLARREHDPRAALAVASFVYAVRKTIGAYVAVLGGVDLLVFTGGIGERSAVVRAEVCAGLDAFGIAVDGERNVRNEATIHGAASRCAVRVVAADEERVIARAVRRILGAPPSA